MGVHLAMVASLIAHNVANVVQDVAVATSLFFENLKSRDETRLSDHENLKGCEVT